MLIRAPGVYRPQADTRLLARALADAAIAPHGRVLDMCTGTGALAIHAASRIRPAALTAVDISRAALASAWLNCRMRGIEIELLRGDFGKMLHDRRFDVVLANPPYVPAASDGPARGAARNWAAGSDGRDAVDAVCGLAPRVLSRTGMLLLVHSSLCGTDRTLTHLREGGLKAAVVARATIPFGPVLRRQADRLARAGLIHPTQRHEELVVIRADRPRQ
ncbi:MULTISPECIES: HemK2/MTQ2 family protein methyltransferase [unclassified Nocardia]|uniref:HemK2/MTQ2 family protein methyltransferase n=1 Tax=unclassified Nocardia TaxID=2637762 RepID=UPI0024A94A9B|nr:MULTISPECIES: HemK2/MTQ2 family protein methyltransferase [unclassified Nocardia]